MAASNTFPLIALLISLISLSSSSFPPQKIGGIGFQGRLIHSNSPRSPLYNPKASPSDRIRTAVSNSFARHRYLESKKSLRASPDWTQAPIRPHRGVYVMSYYIGTPPTETFAIADTASDIMWLQCLPCDDCFNQKQPIFDPEKSSTYRIITCNEPECQALSTNRCKTGSDLCKYGVVYLDQSYSDGDLSSETMIFGDTISGNVTLQDMAFGCGHMNSETSEPDDFPDNAPGNIGLNNQSLSFLSQLGMNEFSYCLVPLDEVNASSLIHFGLSASIVGGRTPILHVDDESNFYYLGLEGISVDNERLPIPAGTFDVQANGDGGFIIDSGTTYTMLNSTGHAVLIQGVANKTLLNRADDATEVFELCYDCSIQELDLAAEITFHFTGVDLVLTTMNAWTNNGKGLWCLAIQPTNGFSILGIHQQQNLNIGHDVMKRVVSFMPMDCTKPLG